MSPLPRNWLWRAASQSNSPGFQGESIVVFDIDGVLSDASGRQHYLASRPRDWKGFFHACDQDPPLLEEVSRFRARGDEVRRVLLTARPLQVQQKTIDWLEAHQIDWDLLIMRDIGDGSMSVTFKEHMIKLLQEEGANILEVVDDDPSICEMYRVLGLPVRYVHSGYYESVVKPPA